MTWWNCTDCFPIMELLYQYNFKSKETMALKIQRQCQALYTHASAQNIPNLLQANALAQAAVVAYRGRCWQRR